jgi:hypothetical protein
LSGTGVDPDAVAELAEWGVEFVFEAQSGPKIWRLSPEDYASSARITRTRTSG